MPIFIDESLQDVGNFIVGAVVHGPDPTVAVDRALEAVGLKPGIDEFKSSARMDADPALPMVRRQLRAVLTGGYRWGVVVAPRNPREGFGEEVLRGLKKILTANGLEKERPVVFLDEGIFRRAADADDVARDLGLDQLSDIRAEQDSAQVRGLQLADLVAHTCGIMLLDQLGLITKTVKAGPSSGYDPDLDVGLGFELWATVRYQFFNGRLPAEINSNEGMVVEVAPYGLYVANSCRSTLRTAAEQRFGRQYLGCIH